ncbi:hypothetical protein OG974_30165 (plasmid) [Streptomyces sp. NBC_00597]|uniref:hypothetical protein n=1 Tax=Streptomyces sp. NBC_00597 TaxID=2975786 RepID=UPI002F9118F8
MRIEGLAEADGFHVAQDFGDGLPAVLHREELPYEGDDRVGDAFHCVRPGLRPGAQGGREDPSDGLQCEGVVTRLRVDAAQPGDREDDPLRDVREQYGHPRIGAGEPGSRFGVAGLHSTEVAEGAEHRVRRHRGERHGGVLEHERLLIDGPPR